MPAMALMMIMMVMVVMVARLSMVVVMVVVVIMIDDDDYDDDDDDGDDGDNDNNDNNSNNNNNGFRQVAAVQRDSRPRGEDQPDQRSSLQLSHGRTEGVHGRRDATAGPFPSQPDQGGVGKTHVLQLYLVPWLVLPPISGSGVPNV